MRSIVVRLPSSVRYWTIVDADLHVHAAARPRHRLPGHGAVAKSRSSPVVPVDSFVVQAYDAYCWERAQVWPAATCDFVLVNLFRQPLGGPMRPGAINELLAALSRRAGLDRLVTRTCCGLACPSRAWTSSRRPPAASTLLANITGRIEHACSTVPPAQTWGFPRFITAAST
jgi:hypothetical protein